MEYDLEIDVDLPLDQFIQGLAGALRFVEDDLWRQWREQHPHG